MSYWEKSTALSVPASSTARIVFPLISWPQISAVTGALDESARLHAARRGANVSLPPSPGDIYSHPAALVASAAFPATYPRPFPPFVKGIKGDLKLPSPSVRGKRRLKRFIFYIYSRYVMNDSISNIPFVKIPPSFGKGRTEHHGKLRVLVSAEIRKHKLARQTLFLT